MPFGWSQEAFHVAAKSFSLVALAKEGIKMLGILLQWGWCWHHVNSFGHLPFLLSLHSTIFSLVNKVPLVRRETQECFGFLLSFCKCRPVLLATATQIPMHAYHWHHQQ